MNIIRKDKTEIQIDTYDSHGKSCMIVLAGFGYGLDHPLLYYCRSIAKQLNLDYIGIDPRYLFNKSYLSLSDEKQDEYFETDITQILTFVNSRIESYESAFYIGKSMGTTIINRAIESDVNNTKSRFVLLTPGIEWEKTIENLAKINNKCLIIGSLADSKYSIAKLVQAKKLSNLSFLEYTDLNHGMESNDVSRDIEIIKEIAEKIMKFIEREIA